MMNPILRKEMKTSFRKHKIFTATAIYVFMIMTLAAMIIIPGGLLTNNSSVPTVSMVAYGFISALQLFLVYVIVPAIGRFGNDEHPYAVINMSKDTAKYLCGKYQQTSFIYSEFADDGKVMSEYWEKKDSEQPYNSNMNPYVLKDTCEEWEDLNGAEDNFTIIGRKFKYSIPFSIFNEIDDTISENISRMISFKAKHGVPMTRSGILYMLEGVGYAPANYRKAIYKGLLECFKC